MAKLGSESSSIRICTHLTYSPSAFKIITLMAVLSLIPPSFCFTPHIAAAQENTPTKISPLIEALNDKDAGIRRSAVEALGVMINNAEGEIGDKADTVVPALIEALKDKDRGVRESAVYVLGGIGDKAEAVVPALIEALKDKDRDVRESANRALWGMINYVLWEMADNAEGKIGDKTDTVASALIEALEGENGDVQESVAYLLRMMIDETTFDGTVLLSESDSDIWRSTAEEALRRFSDPSSTTSRQLVQRDRGSTMTEWLAPQQSVFIPFETGEFQNFDPSALTNLFPLQEFIYSLGDDKALSLVAQADTDVLGDTATLQGELRADAVRSFLQESGVPSDMIDTIDAAAARRAGIETQPAEPGVTVVIGQRTVPYYWNMWPQPKNADWLTPVVALSPGTEYTMHVDLSHVAYDFRGVDYVKVRQEFAQLVAEAKRVGKVELVLDPVLLTDRRFFTTPAHVLEKIKIDLQHVQEFELGAKPRDPDATLAALEDEASPDFLISRIVFELETTAARGWASFGLSFWHKGRPFDELIFHRCVGRVADCPESERPSGTSLGGSELFDLTSDTSSRRPDAALHLIELSERQVVGVFARNTTEEAAEFQNYHVWNLDLPTDELLEHMHHLQESFGKATKNPVSVGKALTNLILPRSSDADNARSAVLAFLNEHPYTMPFAENRPTLFVRFLRNRSGEDPLFPIGLLNLSNDDSGFLGYRTLIHTPLNAQSYGVVSCPTNWQTVLPVESKDPILKDAREKISNLKTPLSDVPYLETQGSPIPVLSQMKNFVDWIGPEFKSPDDENGLPSVILTVVSHHDHSKIFFEEEDPADALNVSAKFQGPSIAILAGCSTGVPGAGGMVNKLNEAGFRSIIATNTGISGKLAGELVDRMIDRLENAVNPPTIGELFGQVQRDFAQETKFGPEILSFTLAGNPDATICLP